MATPTPTVSVVASAAVVANGTVHLGANFFYGFLITFAVLFLVFGVCGIGSRRRFLATRQALFREMLEPWASATLDGEYRRPVLYEKPIMAGQDDWGSIMPLSAHIIPESEATDQEDSSAPPSSSVPASRIPAIPNPADVNPPVSVPAWIRDRVKPQLPLLEEKPKEEELPQSLQIAVLINMPRYNGKDSEGWLPDPPSKISIDTDVDRHRKNSHAYITTGPIPGFEIGVLRTRVPWHSETSSARMNLNRNPL